MKFNKRTASMTFLILGMAALIIGFGTNSKVFSYAAVAFVLISLVLGGRWLRPRRR